MDANKATERPWIVFHDPSDKWYKYRIYRGLAEGPIANVLRGKEDAELIVRAVNAHDDLLRELSHLVRLLEPLERDGGLNVPGLATLNGAREAIRKAAGE